MNRIFVLTASLMLAALMVSAQSAGIGTNAPHSSSILDITSTTKGFLLPRMSANQRIAIPGPAAGLQVYQTDGTKGVYYFDGNIWTLLGPSGNFTGWSLTGNATINPASNFIGTTDAQPLIGKANGEQVFRFAPNSNNTVMGYQASHLDYAGGTYNHIIGYKAGYNNSGSFSHFDGLNTGYNNGGNSNQFIGYNTGYTNTTGYNNLFIGSAAGYSNTTGSLNSFIGYQAGYQNTISNENHFIGYQAGFNNTGQYNFFEGSRAGYSNTTGNANFFVGYKAGVSNVTGSNNYFSGYGAGYSNTQSDNHFSGFLAGYFNTTGWRNQFVGYRSGYYNTTGNNNVFYGYESGFNNTTGTNNTFVGFRSGYSHTGGQDNIFIGHRAGYNHIDGLGNIFIGPNAGSNELGSYKLYISHNDSPNPLIYGDFGINLFRVNGAAQITEVTNNNVPVLTLTECCDTYSKLRFKKTVASNSSWDIGAFIDPVNSNFNHLDFISNGLIQMILHGNGNLVISGDLTEQSDSTLKEKIFPIQHALDNIRKMNGYTYEWKDKSVKSDRDQIGFLAQEVEQVYPQLVKTDDKGVKSVSYTHMVPVLLEAIKEQQNEIDALQQKMAQMEEMINTLVQAKD